MKRQVDLKPKIKSYPWRRTIQISFLLLNVLLGYLFYRFVSAAQGLADPPFPRRPPGVEGWLPISGLMGLIDWIATGTLNTIHPAATILVVTFILVAFLLRKSFCGWLCPVGTISDGLANLGKRVFKRNFKPPRWLDYPLMGIKYLLLGFFLWAFVTMGTAGIHEFIQSPYNQVADVKMLLFFAQLSTTAGIVLIGLAVGSIFIQGFWCRYLCPYGALLGLFSWMSPVKVRRNSTTCIDCAKCDKICPARLPIMAKEKIKSVECTGCMECVLVCPVKDTLDMGTKKTKLSPARLSLLLGIMFIVLWLGARLSGAWQNSVTDQQYRDHISKLNSGEYGHPGM